MRILIACFALLSIGLFSTACGGDPCGDLIKKMCSDKGMEKTCERMKATVTAADKAGNKGYLEATCEKQFKNYDKMKADMDALRKKGRATHEQMVNKAAAAKPAPAKPAPTKAAPAKPAPTKAAPTKAVPTKVAPTKASPTKVAPTKAAPTKVAPTAKPVTKPAKTK